MSRDTTLIEGPLDLRAGEVVAVRSADEIRATLDAHGALDGLPFMDEMWTFCGRRFRVFRRADKVCVDDTILRRMRDAVFLEELRCDGSRHDGCKKSCLFFWKEAWLARAAGEPEAPPAPDPALCTDSPAPPGQPADFTYDCQSSRLSGATQPLSRWQLRQYVRDVTSGNFSVLQVLQALGIVLYNRVSRLLGGRDFGSEVGSLVRTPTVSLGLQPGELVEVRSREEIAATLDASARNRGLLITWEMLRHAGRRFRVYKRVDRIILEGSGRMRSIKDTVLLEGAACEGVCRRACARYSHPLWREAWLKRVEAPPAADG